jgi:anti-sigma B factor antagonist
MTEVLTVTVREADGGATVLTVGGEIDLDSAHVLGTAGEEALLDGVAALVLDLRGVTFCDSTGLKTFVQLHRLAADRGASLRLAGAPRPVSTVIKAVNLDRMLALHPTIEDALNAGR